MEFSEVDTSGGIDYTGVCTLSIRAGKGRFRTDSGRGIEDSGPAAFAFPVRFRNEF